MDWFEVDASGRRCVWRGEDPVRTPSKKLDPFWRSWGGGKKQGNMVDIEEEIVGYTDER